MATTPSTIDPRDVGTPDAWIPRHPELVRLTGRHPFNCEPPLEHLRSFITPTPLHYVRNHAAVPRLDWSTHTFRVDGLVDNPKAFTMSELLAAFPDDAVSLPVLLVCAGNRRKEQNMIKKSIGFNWGAGAASTAVWTGIPLHCLLAFCGVDRARARFVWFEGADVMPKSNYGTCIRASVALDPSCDVLVAWKMNGELLAPDHGFPLRLIVPGHIGGRMVKWLKRIHVSDRESDNPHHLHDNRVLPSDVDAERATAENWWVKPEFAIQELNVNSVLLSPAHMETVDRNNFASARTSPMSEAAPMYKVSGYAYSGGGRQVIRVEITLDDGFTWDSCKVIVNEKANAYGKMWCWVQYELDVPLVRVLGASEMCVRAWDAAMNTQPEYPTWNVMGMMNNPWFRVKIKQDSADEFHFEHPTQVGGKREGWMVLGKGQTRPTIKHKLSADSQAQPETAEATPAKTQLPAFAANLPVISAVEVAKHTTEKSCWFICRGLVYDATEFLELHPGGASSILLSAGTDCTDEFESIHSPKAWKMLEKYCIGVCASTSAPAQVNPQAPSTAPESTKTAQLSTCASRDIALDGSSQRVPLVLIAKEIVSHDARIFRFALPAKHMRLGLPIGNHVMLFATVNGKTVVRSYTPISSNSDEDAGFVSFLIKIYFAGENPAHPEGGKLSQYLENLHLGSQIEMKGPIGHFTYYADGYYSLGSSASSAKQHATKFGFIAGGTGITPVYQVLRAILTNPSDSTKVALIYCVRTSKDLLLQDELEQLQRLKPDNCTLYFTMTEMDEREKARVLQDPRFQSYGTARISREMIERVIGKDASHVGLCGPPGMIQYACLPALKQLGYDVDAQVTVF